MNDWKRTLEEKTRRKSEETAIADLEARTAPFYWMLIVCSVLLMMFLCWLGWYRYTLMAEQNEQIVRCLNGNAVWIGDAVLHCDVRKVQLVAGIKP